MKIGNTEEDDTLQSHVFIYYATPDLWPSLFPRGILEFALASPMKQLTDIILILPMEK